jgi:hypothetical protein
LSDGAISYNYGVYDFGFCYGEMGQYYSWWDSSTSWNGDLDGLYCAGEGLKDGLHVYHVQCQDFAGNQMEMSKTIVFYIDTSGNYELTIHCMGTGTPTIILENGLDWQSFDDSTLQRYSAISRTCTYIRRHPNSSDGPVTTLLGWIIFACVTPALSACSQYFVRSAACIRYMRHLPAWPRQSSSAGLWNP